MQRQPLPVEREHRQRTGRYQRIRTEGGTKEQGKPVVARGEISVDTAQVPAIFVEVISVDQSNLAKTVIADGFHSQQAIDAGR